MPFGDMFVLIILVILTVPFFEFFPKGRLKIHVVQINLLFIAIVIVLLVPRGAGAFWGIRWVLLNPATIQGKPWGGGGGNEESEVTHRGQFFQTSGMRSAGLALLA